jgi:cytochrome b subunit of formate dehydrogenase
MKNIPRMNLHLRIQHGLLALFFLATIVTGLGYDSWLPAVEGFRPGIWYRLHLWSGLGAAGLLLYHFFYLAIRGYVEGLDWRSFPLRWTGKCWREAWEEIVYLFGRGPERPKAGHYRVSQKALYWSILAGLCVALGTGGILRYWKYFGDLMPLPLLPRVAGIHWGVAMVLVALFLWHLYGVLVWEGKWDPEWAWLSGGLKRGKAERKVPGFFEDYLRRELERQEHLKRKSPEEYEEEMRRLEREEVEAELAVGNQLARDDKFVEALSHYRRALEKYPGYSQARYNMARVFQKMGERMAALEAYRQFLEDDPFHPLARQAQETILELEGRKGP